MSTRRIVQPLLDRATYRRWAYLILGGALLVPYLLFSTVAVPATLPVTTTVPQALVLGALLTLLAMLASSLLPAVRVLEGTAVRELLDDPVPGAAATVHGWPDRLRASAMFMLHVLVGGVISFLSLILPILLVLVVAAPFTGRVATSLPGSPEVPKGVASAWIPVVALLAVVGLCYLVSASGALLARAAPALLGLSAGARIAELERRTERLSERNRLARELHDSVGHAVSVVTLQAAAARRTLRSDPEASERALLAIESSSRAALDDLDYVLGLLREDRASTAPALSLDELDSLLAATRSAGNEVSADLRGDVTAIPPVVSREAYRIVQECLTNVLRHAGKVPVTLAVRVDGEHLELDVRNPAPAGAGRSGGGGRGLRGIAERAEVLGGVQRAGLRDGNWEVAVRLPIGTRGRR